LAKFGLVHTKKTRRKNFPVAVFGDRRRQWCSTAVNASGPMPVAVRSMVQGGGQWRKDQEKKVAAIKVVQKI